MKCACGDGGLVHPWECCSTGTCNIFCCNCGGPCRKNTTDEIIELPKSIYDALNSERVKRSAYAEFSPVDFNVSWYPFVCHIKKLVLKQFFSDRSTFQRS